MDSQLLDKPVFLMALLVVGLLWSPVHGGDSQCLCNPDEYSSSDKPLINSVINYLLDNVQKHSHGANGGNNGGYYDYYSWSPESATTVVYGHATCNAVRWVLCLHCLQAVWDDAEGLCPEKRGANCASKISNCSIRFEFYKFWNW